MRRQSDRHVAECLGNDGTFAGRALADDCLKAVGESGVPVPVPVPASASSSVPKPAPANPIQPEWDDRVPFCSALCPSFLDDKRGEWCCESGEAGHTRADGGTCCLPAIRRMNDVLVASADREDSLEFAQVCAEAAGRKTP